MSEEQDKFVLASLLDLKADVKQIDAKFDEMHKVLITNSVILTEHERRSTASEARLSIVEDRVIKSEKQSERVKGFFWIGGGILAAFTSIIGIIKFFLK